VPAALVTGSGGLVGSESVRQFSESGFTQEVGDPGHLITDPNDPNAGSLTPVATDFAALARLGSLRSVHRLRRQRDGHAQPVWRPAKRPASVVDRAMHSLFGVSKAAADLLAQEYGRYFGMPTVCFRAGCVTGPRHAGAQLHGFLSYLI